MTRFPVLRLSRQALVVFLSWAPELAADQHVLRNLTASYRPDADLGVAIWSADGERALFEICDNPFRPCWLATATRNPGDVVELAGPFFPASPQNLRFALSADGRRAIYRGAPEDEAAPRELWGAPVDLSLPPVRIHQPLVTGEDLRFFRLSPDGERVALVIRRAVGEEELHLGHVDGTPLSVPVDAGVAFDENDLAFSPDGSELVYWIDTDGDDDLELRATTASTGISRSVSGATHAAASERGELLVSADSTRVVFAAEVADSGRMFLTTAEIDPDGEERDLTGGVAPGSSVGAYALADAGRVVFLGDLAVAGQVELWSIPADGSLERVRLNGDLPESGDVDSFRLAGDWVAYLADEAVNERWELWSAPVHGLFEPTRRSGALLAGRDVDSFQVTADGAHLIYAADGEVNERTDLYRTTTSGLTSIVRLSNRNPFQTEFYSVVAFALAPDSRTLAWRNGETGPLPDAILEQDLLSPTDFAPLLASPAWAVNLRYLGDPFGIGFRGHEVGGFRLDILTLDLRLFADGFESGSASEWAP